MFVIELDLRTNQNPFNEFIILRASEVDSKHSCVVLLTVSGVSEWCLMFDILLTICYVGRNGHHNLSSRHIIILLHWIYVLGSKTRRATVSIFLPLLEVVRAAPR